MDFIAKILVAEHGLDDILAVVERSSNGNIIDIGCLDRRHLPPLHPGDAPLGMQDADAHVATPGAGMNGGGTGVAGRCADDGDLVAATFENTLEHPPEKLEGEILEGQSRPVKQFEDPCVMTDLPQGCCRRMGETGIGLVCHFQQFIQGETALGKGGKNPGRGLRIAQPAQGARVDLRPALGHEQATIFGEAGQQHIFKGSSPAAAAGAAIVNHDRTDIPGTAIRTAFALGIGSRGIRQLSRKPTVHLRPGTA